VAGWTYGHGAGAAAPGVRLPRSQGAAAVGALPAAPGRLHASHADTHTHAHACAVVLDCAQTAAPCYKAFLARCRVRVATAGSHQRRAALQLSLSLHCIARRRQSQQRPALARTAQHSMASSLAAPATRHALSSPHCASLHALYSERPGPQSVHRPTPPVASAAARRPQPRTSHTHAQPAAKLVGCRSAVPAAG
jgi:hypothetical protein